MKQVLFVCVANSGRSQMAEAFFNKYAEGWARAESAGTRPPRRVNLHVVQIMAEVGIDLSHKKPKLLTSEMLEHADRVIAMGCEVQALCPMTFVPTEVWDLEEPHSKPIEVKRRIRDEVEVKVRQLVEELKSPQSPIRE